MSKQVLKLNDIEDSTKGFDASKQAIPLSSVNTKNIVVSYKVKHNDFIDYSHVDVIRPFCVILPQISRYIKYFENGEKNMSFKIEEKSVYLKYSEIWNKFKSILNVKFDSQPIYDEKYMKSEVKICNNTINTLFSGHQIPTERIRYVCISAICIDFVMRVDKKNYPQVYLKQCK